jgi:filamentous hemagglutinin family protein
MKTKSLSLSRRFAAGVMLFAFALRALANPIGISVTSGTATTQTSGSKLTVTTSQLAVLNWQSFNIAAGETTVFNQPNAYSVVVNRINDQNASQIYGSLQANGIVILMNSSGFYFGPNSFVSAAGLVVSTANCIPPQNSGGSWEFNGPPPLKSIVNYGSIQVGNGGSVYLIADQVENHGSIEAPGGSIGLAAGQTVTLSERPDGRGMSMAVTLPQGSVNNCGNLIADAGTIALNAKVVNQDGIIQANSVQNQNGTIELVASAALTLGADSQILAQGDAAAAGSAGGSVTLQSGNSFSDVSGSEISVAGGANGGDGGSVEVCASGMPAFHTKIDGSAQAGYVGGTLLLDPDYIILGGSSGSSADTLCLDVNSAFTGLSQITLQAKYDITLANGTVWDLSGSTGVSDGQLVLQAGRNIIFASDALGSSSTAITDAGNWSVTLQAGYNFTSHSVTHGLGSIYLGGDTSTAMDGNGAIQTAAGDITLEAGLDILVGSGFVRTTGGGSVSAWARKGDINTGTYDYGYTYEKSTSSGGTFYEVDGNYGVGGISTAAGGNVSLIAGGNVTSYLPSQTDTSDAGTGAFGPEAGNVTVVAGGNVTGHYIVANGTGRIIAGAKMDAHGNPLDAAGHLVTDGASYATDASSTGSAGTGTDAPLALSLISGGWMVDAANNINLQEVRNPNGIFNNLGGKIVPASYHYFDYSADAYVDLIAGNAVTLAADSATLPRNDDLPIIFPSILNIVAGAGGVSFSGNSTTLGELILFPSSLGSLSITTTGGLTGSSPSGLYDLIVSDSGYHQYYDVNAGVFGLDDHAATPIHENSTTTVSLGVGGDLKDILLSSPEAAQILVGGNMISSGFQGMNLHASDVTRIVVAGNIENRSEFTTAAADAAPLLEYLSEVSPDSADAQLAANLTRQISYDAKTGTLVIQGLTGKILSLLQSLTVLVYQDGSPVVNADGSYQTKVVSVIDATTAAHLQAALDAQTATYGTVTDNSYGYILGGGGKFVISANRIDLGTTLGIQSQGVIYDTAYLTGKNYQPIYDANGNPEYVYPLATYCTSGADIQVTTAGDLNMFSTQISSQNGGAISITAGGQISVGSDYFTDLTSQPRGIFTTAGSDITVIAAGNINVNGSRIAAYDGGNVTVESREGNINAGTGASSVITVAEYYVDPATREVYSEAKQIPFSGILALTFPTRDTDFPAPVATLGNILVEAPHGDVTANEAGILQLALNQSSYPAATTTVLAGYELRNDQGQAVTAANWSSGTPVLVSDNRNIVANGSGIIAGNATLEASGDISGLIFARNNINITAQQNVDVTALGQGNVSVGAGGSISGTIIGVGGVSASGGSIDASLISANVTGGTTSGQSGLGQGTAASTAANAASASDDSGKTAAKSDDSDDDDLLKKKNKGKGGIVLAQKTGRVTVLLPQKN